MYPGRIPLLVAAAGLLAGPALATPPLPFRAGFRHLTVADGLPHDTVTAVAQDAVGFMWFGTEAGLCRWDGRQLDVIRQLPGPAGSSPVESISAVLVDSAGGLWVGTWGGGLSRYEPATESLVPVPGSLADGRVTCLLEDRAGAIWIGTWDGGLARREPGESGFVTLRHDRSDPGSLAADRVTALVEDLYGALWVGTDRGLDRLTGTPVAIEHVTALSDARVRALGSDRLGRVWVGTAGGVEVLDPATLRLEVVPVGAEGASLPPSARATAISMDRTGTLWVGTMDRGLYALDLERRTWTHLVNDPLDPRSLARDDIRAVFQDHSGVLWVATGGGGLSALDRKPPKLRQVVADPRSPLGLGAGRVLALAEDASRRLWVGGEAGLSRFDEAAGGFLRVAFEGALRAPAPASVTALLATAEGALWVGTSHGLVRLGADDRVLATFRSAAGVESTLSCDEVTALAPGSDGTVWVGTSDGLNLLDPSARRCRRFRAGPQSLADNVVRSLLVDADNRLWVGTDAGGLDVLDVRSDSWKHVATTSQTAGPLGDRVQALLRDARGRLWAGTAAGLGRVDPANDAWTATAVGAGEQPDSVLGILEDPRGVLWLGTSRGVTRFDPASGAARHFDRADGAMGGTATAGACLEGRDGTLYFGAFNGFTVCQPEGVLDNPNVPRLVLRGLRSFDGARFAERSLLGVETVTLRPAERFFTLSFAALDYSDPTRNRYAYRLEPLDRDWVDAGTSNTASYTNVDPGRYRFTVRGSNNDWVWNEAGAAVVIVVPPPLWATWWFRLLGLAAVALAAYAGYRQRVRHEKRERLRLQNLVDERTRELSLRRDQLQQVNDIVRSINSQPSFDELLDSLLRELSTVKGVDRAAALVWDREVERFRFRAVVGWSPMEREWVELTAAEAHTRYVASAVEIDEDLFVSPNTGELPAAGKLPAGETWAAMLVMRIRFAGRVDGYLVLDSVHDANAFKDQDLLLLRALREHILTAFVRARMLHELAALNEKKNELLGMAVHDLRSPLGLIQGWAQVLMKQVSSGRMTTERMLKDLSRVVQVAEQMTALVTQLLDVSAIESGKVHIELAPQSLSSVLEECNQLHSRLAAAKQISLSLELSTVPPVLADRFRLSEVIDNLLSNAIKFTPAGGEVRVWSEVEGAQVVTHVRDSGPGLTDEDLKLVFRRFGKLSARPTGGESSTGLGLAIVKKIIDEHGGRVWVSSRPGEGSTFSFSLLAAEPRTGSVPAS